MKAITEKREPEYAEVWRISGLFNVDGNPVKNEEYTALLSREVSLLLISRGTGLVLEMVTDSAERLLRGATVLYAEYIDNSNMLIVTTRNTIYHFERLKMSN